jgi:hypothetical protein
MAPYGPFTRNANVRSEDMNAKTAKWGSFALILGITWGGVAGLPGNSEIGASYQGTTAIHANFNVTFARGHFVAVGRDTSPLSTCRLITSTNGINWEAVVRPTTSLRAVQISGTEHHLRSVVFTGRELPARGDSSIVLTSGDGLSWSSVPFWFFNARITSTGEVIAPGQCQRCCGSVLAHNQCHQSYTASYTDPHTFYRG